jgi:hypothetical protein
VDINYPGLCCQYGYWLSAIRVERAVHSLGIRGAIEVEDGVPHPASPRASTVSDIGMASEVRTWTSGCITAGVASVQPTCPRSPGRWDSRSPAEDGTDSAPRNVSRDPHPSQMPVTLTVPPRSSAVNVPMPETVIGVPAFAV